MPEQGCWNKIYSFQSEKKSHSGIGQRINITDGNQVSEREIYILDWRGQSYLYVKK